MDLSVVDPDYRPDPSGSSSDRPPGPAERRERAATASSLTAVSSIVSYPSPLTWDEFLALPFETRNAALIDGEVVVNPPNAQHELIVRNLNLVFTTWLRSGGGRGEVSTQQPVGINARRGCPGPDAPFVDRELGPGETVTSPLLDGFAVPVDELFRR
jgi:Uma2 family endonuclease